MPTRKLLLALAVATALLATSACTIQKKGEGKDEKVKIETPVGGLNVDTEANPQDVGLAIYPGATLNPKPEGEHSSANVNISSSLFGVKVIALDYVSNDPPAKVIDFYKKELSKYGSVVECKGDGKAHFAFGVHDDSSDALTCKDKPDPGSNKVEMAVGTKERERIVSVEPKGSGSKFAVVYVQTRGKEGTL